MKIQAIIPARYASTRFPGKPLALLGGKEIIQHVYERAAEVFEEVWVATDDERIAAVVERFGGRCVMTSAAHKSGTDRCREAMHKTGLHPDVVVNIQGDEPFVRQEQLRELCRCFEDESTQIATLVKPFTPEMGLEALKNPNSPKVVVGLQQQALYFSRSVIPYLRNVPEEQWLSRHTFYKHIGLYAYRAEMLDQITDLRQSPLEFAESLEQLRWLEAGLKIRVGFTNHETIGIDTPEDLRKAEEFLRSNC